MNRLTVLAAALIVYWSTAAHAALITSASVGALYDADAILGNATQGDDMVDMTVLIQFTDLTTQSLTWVATGNGTGGAFGVGVDITQGPGSTWSNRFLLDNTSGKTISDITLHGFPGETVFDTTFGTGSTAGSANGKNIQESGTSVRFGQDVFATYFDQVQLMGAAPVGDLYAGLRIEFDIGLANNSQFGFITDTDNVTPGSLVAAAPEPSSLALLGLLVIGANIRRKRKPLAVHR